MTTSAPLLSIVMAVRHDADDDRTARFLGALRFNHEQLAAHGVPHEFVLVELNRRESGVSLSDIAVGAISGLRDGTLAAFAVDPRYHEALSPNAASDHVELVAKNAGIRRARGAFVLCIGCDVCIGRRVLRRITDGTIESGILYRALRVDIRMDSQPVAFDLTVLEQPRSVVGRPRAPRPPLYLDGGGDFILLDRASLHDLRGFNEMGCFDADSVVSKAYAEGYPIQSLGAPVYHIHDRPNATATERDRDDVAAQMHRQMGSTARVTLLNPDTWGLSAAPERALGPHRVWLDFDWSAVPSLVDLNRVVLRPPRIQAEAIRHAATLPD